MKVLIVGLNYAPENVGIAVYTTGLAEALVRAGHQVRVIAGQPYYPGWKTMPGHDGSTYSNAEEDGVRIIRTPHYVPAWPSGAKRLLHHASFALSSFFPTLWQGLVWRPDLVLAIAPSLLSAPGARIAAFLAGARSWLHFQDFEVDAAVGTGLLSGDGLPVALALRFEAALLRMFHRVSAISPEMCHRLRDKGASPEQVVEFRNWADTDTIRPLTGPSPYRDRWQITTPHVALYSGNIANKQGIEIVINAARLLVHRTDLTFVICGEGPTRERLETIAAGLGNVRFFGLQPRERLDELLGLATVHLLPQAAGVADLMLPSKLTNMLASGRPVVATAAAGTGLAREVEDCGVVVEPGDVSEFARGIETLVEHRSAWVATARRARARAEERWSRELVLGHLLEILEGAGRRRKLVTARGNADR